MTRNQIWNLDSWARELDAGAQCGRSHLQVPFFEIQLSQGAHFRITKIMQLDKHFAT